jgi:transcriptional regulator with XRE-family HTH domain
MNMHAPLPLDEVPPVPADDAVARMLREAALVSEGELRDAVEARRVQIGLSLAALDQLSGLSVGHASKALSPARLKSPTLKTLFALLDALALSIVLVVDGAKAERISPSWRPRAEMKVRTRSLSPLALQRARPMVLAELARRAARPKWAKVSARDFMRAQMEKSA